jgi:prevent-host-death family protein
MKPLIWSNRPNFWMTAMAVSAKRSRRAPGTRPSTWTLQDAKAHLSDVLRRARTDGPQHVTVHGRETAVILSEEAFARLKGGQTGQALIEALQASPHRDIDLATAPVLSAVRDVEL